MTPVTDQEQRVGFSTTTSLESASFIIFEREAALRGLWYGRLVEVALMDNVSAFTENPPGVLLNNFLAFTVLRRTPSARRLVTPQQRNSVTPMRHQRQRGSCGVFNHSSPRRYAHGQRLRFRSEEHQMHGAQFQRHSESSYNATKDTRWHQ